MYLVLYLSKNNIYIEKIRIKVSSYEGNFNVTLLQLSANAEEMQS